MFADLDQLRLDGLKLVVDCAHGAAYKVAPEVLWELGAEVIPVRVPDIAALNAVARVILYAEASAVSRKSSATWG